MSSFFSLHRPISVTKYLPEETTIASFASIFDPKVPARTYEPLEVVKTIGNAVEEMENADQDGMGDAAEEDADFPVQLPSRAIHRAGVPKDVPVSKLGEFRPFMPPPVPEPMGGSKAKKASKAVKPRTWKTTITVTEHTTPTGQKVYSAASTPLERIATGKGRRRTPIEAVIISDEVSEPTRDRRGQQPFLNRLRQRQVIMEKTKREQMHAISVKRQRKLKMKKHKYKKLMKRTRNLRRKLGKL